MLVADSLNGQPAIRFDGKSDYLLTTPLETTDDQTVVLVCSIRRALSTRIAGGAARSSTTTGPIANPKTSNRIRTWPNDRYLSNTLEPGVLQIGEPLVGRGVQANAAHRPGVCRFHRQRDRRGRARRRGQVGANKPVDRGLRVRLRIRAWAGVSDDQRPTYGEARAFAPQGITSRKIIGRHAWMQHYFHGDLAEMLIYNKAFSAEELAETTAYLADKYEIALDEQPAAQIEAGNWLPLRNRISLSRREPLAA